jgi:hypothetical protein
MDYIMNSDSLGKIFRVEKRLGRGDIFEVISHFPDGTHTASEYHHEYYDGMGAILNESEQWSGSRLTLPRFNLKTAVEPSYLLSGLAGLKDDLTPSKTRWKSLSPSEAYTPRHLAWRYFSAHDTQELLFAARSEKISMNTLLLAAASRIIAQELLSPDEDQLRWLIPVNMRRNSGDLLSKRNHTSSVGMRFSKTATMNEIDRIYRQALNGWRALSGDSLARIVASLGEDTLYRLAKHRGGRNFWIGSFSNLGVWNFPEAADAPHWPRAVSIAPPAGTPCFPVGIGIMTWQGRLSFSLRLHAALIQPENTGLQERILDKIIDFLSVPLNKTLTPEGSSKTVLSRPADAPQ